MSRRLSIWHRSRYRGQAARGRRAHLEALAEIANALGNVRGSTGDTLRELSESIAARVAEAAPVPVENTSKPPGPAESRDHVVILDVGKAVGGASELWNGSCPPPG